MHITARRNSVQSKNGNAVQIGKAALCYLADHCGLNAIARARHRDSVLVLSYHGVISDKYARHPLRLANMVTRTEFREQMQELRRLFNPVTIRDVRKWVHGSGSLPPHAVLVTFDDGYSNSLTHAVDVLRETGVPAVFFLPTGYIGGKRVLWPTEVYLRVYTWPESHFPMPDGTGVKIIDNHEGRATLATLVEETCKQLPTQDSMRYLCQLRRGAEPLDVAETFGEAGEEMFSFLDWGGVRKIHQLGFEIGSHSVEHPILAKISQERLDQELTFSKRAIESELDAECYCFAYPNGGRRDFTEETPAAISRAGYELGFTLIGRMCDRSLEPVQLDRVWIPGGDGLAGFRTRTSGMFTNIKRLAGEY
jgi:peptidoglycan/xylan/chitin deacetylase (PgdA/CDA1 family)